MIITRFRLQNYKNFDDTDWIEVEHPTVFVGKNEVGKTSLFRGLSKLNPSDRADYDRLKDFPRNRLTSDYHLKDWPAASAVFTLEKDESNHVRELYPKIKNLNEISVTRYYSGKLEIEFGLKHEYLTNNEIIKIILEWIKHVSELIGPDDKGPIIQGMKNSIIPKLEQATNALKQDGLEECVDLDRLESLFQIIDTNVNEEWQTKVLSKIIKQEEKLKDYQSITEQIYEVHDYLEESLPIFVYFDEYGIIDTAVNIPRFIVDMKEYPNDLGVRSKKCLFEHVGLDIETLNKLDPTDPNKTLEELRRLADERHILMNSASQEMTQKFQNWWEQRKHQFRYQIDGPHFRVWVSDNFDPSEIELDERSKGLQYFFSFYLVFLEEAEKRHKNSILLLDEPGLHIHAGAQQKIVQFLETLAEKNQLMYTTHSPFMIDGDKLENVRIIYEDKRSKKSKISQDTWPSDQEALFPLQAGLGYSIAQTLFYAKRQLIVEGLSDFEIIKAMNHNLSDDDRVTLDSKVVVVPAGGTRKIMPLASMLIGHKVKTAVLLDGDDVGKRKDKELRKRLKLNTLLITDYIDAEEGEIEDLFEESLYFKAVETSYPDIELDFTEAEEKEKCISKKVKALFERKGEEFEKWKPMRILSEWARSGEEPISKQTKKRFEKMFREANKILK
jgi:predicted ATP-dependent endonuclease of OLD family